MMLKPDQERVRTLLKDTITLLCRNGLSFNAKFCIDAVIGVTLDDRELFYMSMNEVIKSEKAQLAEQEANNEEESEVDEGSHKRRLGKEPRKRHKNKRPRIKNEEGGSSSEEERLESVTHEDDDESYTGSGNFQAEGGVDDASSDPQNSLMMGVKREQDKDDDENNDIVFIKEEMDDNWGPSGSNNTSTSQGSFFQGVPGSSNQDSGMFQSGDNQQEQSFGSLSDMNLVPVGSQEGAMMWAQSTSSTQYQGVGRGRGRGRSSMGVTSQGDSSTQPGLDQQISNPTSKLGQTRIFQCDICLQVVSNRDSLNKHRQRHEGIYMYHCTVCGKGCGSTNQLHGHMVRHTGKKDHKCHVCGQEFAYKSTLKHHLKHSSKCAPQLEQQ